MKVSSQLPIISDLHLDYCRTEQSFPAPHAVVSESTPLERMLLSRMPAMYPSQSNDFCDVFSLLEMILLFIQKLTVFCP